MKSSPRRIKPRAVDGILLLDKPCGLTSNAALQRVKRLFRADKAGHTGSLDPLATGLLPICMGQATKLSAHLLDADKTYRARVQLGSKTTTGDADGRIVESRASSITRAQLESLIPQFLGSIRQVPPMYSALKRDGEKLYKLARECIEIEREPREVVIHRLSLLSFDAQSEAQSFEFEVQCSKGTYVRTLAEDWAAAAGELAHLTALRRTGLGRFDASTMIDLQALEDCGDEAAREHLHLQPLLSVLPHWPRLSVDASAARELRAGTPITVDAVLAAGWICVLDESGRLTWLAEHDGAGTLSPRRWLGRDALSESNNPTSAGGPVVAS